MFPSKSPCGLHGLWQGQLSHFRWEGTLYGVTYGRGNTGNSNNIVDSSSSSMEIMYDDDYFLDADEGGMFTIEDPEIDGSIVADGTFSSSSGLS
jgi:hypothetical protein